MLKENTMKGCVFEKKKENKIRTRRELKITFHKVKKVVLLSTLWSKTGAEWTSNFENTAFVLHKNFWNRSIQMHLLQVNQLNYASFRLWTKNYHTCWLIFIEGISQSFMEINDIFLWSETMEMAECVRVAKFVPNV